MRANAYRFGPALAIIFLAGLAIGCAGAAKKKPADVKPVQQAAQAKPAVQPAPAKPAPKLSPAKLAEQNMEAQSAIFKKAAFVHQPVQMDQCNVCHRDPAHPKVLTKKVPDLCLGCHPKRVADMKKKHLHPAFAAGECTSCHDPHASENPRRLMAKGNDVCFTCHQADSPALKTAHIGITSFTAACLSCHDAHASDKEKLLLTGDIHFPYGKGNCAVCHATPGADGKVALNGGGEKICLVCHANLAKVAEGEKVHPPFAARKCWDCHWPHATREPVLMKAPTAEVCAACHPGIPKVGHPTGEHPSSRAGKMNPLNPARPFDCASCHQPHHGSPDSLLRVKKEELCKSCHGK